MFVEEEAEVSGSGGEEDEEDGIDDEDLHGFVIEDDGTPSVIMSSQQTGR
jgi:hypothetical protein